MNRDQFVQLHSTYESIEEVEDLISCLKESRDYLNDNVGDTPLLSSKIPTYNDIMHAFNVAIKNLEDEEMYLKSMFIMEGI